MTCDNCGKEMGSAFVTRPLPDGELRFCSGRCAAEFVGSFVDPNLARALAAE